MLLRASRFFGVPDDETLEAMLRHSAESQQEVTDLLGYQVRRAVEMLVQAFDRIDRDRQRALLGDLREEELYEAALAVMMRLVFLMSAEEREMLPLGEPLYDQNYAVSTLQAALREQADQFGEEVLEPPAGRLSRRAWRRRPRGSAPASLWRPSLRPRPLPVPGRAHRRYLLARASRRAAARQ